MPSEAPRSVVGSQSDLGILSHLARQIPDFRDLERQLSGAIGRDGEVLDGASPQLAEMRVRARETFNALESSLQRMMRGLYAKGVLQESLITQRQGRMVLLVKAEMRHNVQGIVHDVSDSGATLFVEPLPTLSQGNQWQELRLAAVREEERVLRELSSVVGAGKDDLLLGMDMLARIDLAMAKARYSASVRGRARRTGALRKAIHPAVRCSPPAFGRRGGPQHNSAWETALLSSSSRAPTREARPLR